MVDETIAELNTSIFVHFRIVEVVLVELGAQIGPESGFSGSEQLTNVRTISSVVSNEIGIEFAGDGSSEAPIEEDRIEDEHA